MMSKIDEMQLLSAGSVRRLELPQRESSRRFSLPFKKRRLYNVVPEDDDIKPPVAPVIAVAPVQTTRKTCTGEERIAALALVAVSSSVSATSASDTTPSSVLPPIERMSSPPTHITESDPIQNVEGITTLQSMQSNTAATKLPPPPVTPLAGEVLRRAPSSSGTPTPKRVHHPPLASPLPGGCHGRTSRNNSYCRRQPCYNNSNYCKLHYQQYVVAGARSPATASPTESGCASNACQDKRFTGTDGEIRCAATTTRGRDCAYTAVNCTKYCFLHSDYDTNPPPRRGNGAKSKNGTVSPKDGSKVVICPPAIPDLSSSSSRRGSLHKIISPNAAMCGGNIIPPHVFENRRFSRKTGKGGHSSSKLLQCDFPLLSTISSDHWQAKHVLIGIGPLANRTGHVERWGNGWVSVRVADAGEAIMHNRRSFELFLIPDNEANNCGVTSSGRPMVEGIDDSSLRVRAQGESEKAHTGGKHAPTPPQIVGARFKLSPSFAPMPTASVMTGNGSKSPNAKIVQ
uniref:Uncharacterized protein n=1 Tax=Grammatophora oceanica TaxID=210454 RepID=A0A7S1YJU5_9STRA|mmetsp:Transcript_53394/g.79757  ORF Transcript_53394/g.79757 Transcript_53394/m.79757 type:complete len:514 (+) Transcript_53394:489-2030(+)|eukprot:CAMPEP_0194042242 /NCGR_PEP_ID=MMETSP0009_2-20130614/14033_1 /TAXON_ID=210454 /ORGANISM="Grammatophora oceanica, Strain CCMP 410" /LENGTH=513 /DNA_ID=CAMNT_0038686009 /DNA_START=458 /DNA_END=1999 /DNA_ORIENTATION=-